MPEGDTIFRVAAGLREALQGKRVMAARPDRFRRLAGSVVTDVRPVGKHLLIRFDSGLAIHSHMRMQGAWHVYRRDERWRRPAWQMKATLETDDVLAVCFGAPLVELVRDEAAHVGHLGPDILTDGWSAAEVLARSRSAGSAAIGELLLDQRITAGIGNVYRCEAMWRCRVNPWKAGPDLSDEALVALYETARTAMRANLAGGRDRVFPGYGKAAVHGRARRPCPRCGTPIKVRAQGEHARLTYWCPTCQGTHIAGGGGPTRATPPT